MLARIGQRGQLQCLAHYYLGNLLLSHDDVEEKEEFVRRLVGLGVGRKSVGRLAGCHFVLLSCGVVVPEVIQLLRGGRVWESVGRGRVGAAAGRQRAR